MPACSVSPVLPWQISLRNSAGRELSTTFTLELKAACLVKSAQQVAQRLAGHRCVYTTSKGWPRSKWTPLRQASPPWRQSQVSFTEGRKRSGVKVGSGPVPYRVPRKRPPWKVKFLPTKLKLGATI